MNRKSVSIRLLLAPFAFIYRLITDVRNMLFEWKLFPSERFPVPVICVGNISVGGTGKTPFTEYLILLLKRQYRVATLSRGYKRKTKGFVLANADCTAKEVGDESCQVKHKFPDITVAVDANRRRGIRRLLALPAEERPHVILLDDAMQHRYVSPSLIIMLTDYNHLYYKDFILPAGNLRESPRAVYRADIIVVTKCGKDIKPTDLHIIEKKMSLTANQHLYFSDIAYHKAEPLFPSTQSHSYSLSEIDKDEDILLVTGIANPAPLIDRMKSHFENMHICGFSDHHSFKQSDIRQIDSLFKKMTSSTRKIMCTEKDAVRLKSLAYLPDEWKPCLYYIPISVEFLFGRGNSFDARILKHIISTTNIQQKKDGKN
ncbi:MAG: tetraacyldisaccharide 4'-kinase [Tannerella sp.]|jgi:tetraacyldisaccharide 4'-kinase|nr:tetraacyldisaccharide 4'-kinase [Tannerella sp.]